ncbi:peptidylprolyl isomerase [Phototrophicus methaneseepsis]|uniref:Peptidyl-prolyl cis-trans isomerase n=1 Tax=Phototrophicus methaneseepsis TaxID=2710758 RepID=A0A7S8E8V1_9CHLR|nr:peptidylprolyl isomerase [Phototrophicus methaneseepsis]QPC82509.1 peptidylprolyl isomerase [Phototrophicus methaneseepsis]
MAKLVNGMVGTIAYTLRVDGNEIEEVTADDGLEYLHGAENIVPGLEAALEGKQVGDAFSVTVQPAEGYGEYDEEAIEDFPTDDVSGADSLEPGMEIEIMDEDDEVYEGTVMEVTKKYIRVDFNDPLAGKVLDYDVEVIDVRAATEEELKMGFPASLLDEMEEYYDEDDHDHDHHNHNHAH